LLRCPPAVAPESAQLAGGGVVVLPRLCLPRAGAAPTANLDHVRPVWAKARYPVVAVAAEIEMPATAPEVVVQRVEHRARPVLRVAGAQHRLVRREQRRAVAVQVLV